MSEKLKGATEMVSLQVIGEWLTMPEMGKKGALAAENGENPKSMCSCETLGKCVEGKTFLCPRTQNDAHRRW